MSRWQKRRANSAVIRYRPDPARWLKPDEEAEAEEEREEPEKVGALISQGARSHAGPPRIDRRRWLRPTS